MVRVEKFEGSVVARKGVSQQLVDNGRTEKDEEKDNRLDYQ